MLSALSFGGVALVLAVAAGIYWKRANTVGAFAGLVLGALAPAGFLLLEGQRENLPHWLAFVADVNVAGLLSYVLAAAGMIVGSLATQRSHPSLHDPGR